MDINKFSERLSHCMQEHHLNGNDLAALSGVTAATISRYLNGLRTPTVDNSSIAVTATRWVVYDEDELKDSGQLKGTTFEKFKSAHSDPVQVDATQDEIDLIAKATGIQSSAIKLVCYERPQFVESQKKGFGLTDILQILLAVLIFALLGYVVFRSTRKQKVEEPEPELSVDALLAATSDNDDENLEDIGYSEKSETRKLIEKFVDENPDAAALLLRNWLNDDWE